VKNINAEDAETAEKKLNTGERGNVVRWKLEQA
jgi:hypothetical protein